MMDIPKIIKEHHQAMINKGFYTCPKCEEKHTACIDGDENKKVTFINPDCKTCNGSGINPNKNIGESLMLVVTELSEALEAHRNNRFSDSLTLETCFIEAINIDPDKAWVDLFESGVKDTFEDEISDIKLRIFDLMGYLKVSYNPNDIRIVKWKTDNVAQRIKQLCQYFLNLDEDYIDSYELSKGLGYIDQFAKTFNINIEKHIIAKMAYNKTRPYKHGKEY